MPSKKRNQQIDSFLERADSLTKEVLATFKDPEQAEARWKKYKESRKKG